MKSTPWAYSSSLLDQPHHRVAATHPPRRNGGGCFRTHIVVKPRVGRHRCIGEGAFGRRICIMAEWNARSAKSKQTSTSSGARECVDDADIVSLQDKVDRTTPRAFISWIGRVAVGKCEVVPSPTALAPRGAIDISNRKRQVNEYDTSDNLGHIALRGLRGVRVRMGRRCRRVSGKSCTHSMS